MSIEFISYKDIDKQKWDACITNASNGLVYGFSFYLDAMAGVWDALVLDDYQAVMPLAYRKKYGITYLYQPAFCANLGVFGKTISENLLNDFLNAVPKKIKYWDIYLNFGNNFLLQHFKTYERINFVLPLQNTYENLYNNFKENIKRNIKKCVKLNCIIKKDIDVDEIIILSKQQANRFSTLTTTDFENIKRVYLTLKKGDKACNYGVYSNGNLVASAAFFFDNKRAYYILVGNHPVGKTIGASHALINEFIKDHANQNLILDFEGSDVPSLANFYSSFGSSIEKYYGIRYNNLPRVVKWLKQ